MKKVYAISICRILDSTMLTAWAEVGTAGPFWRRFPQTLYCIQPSKAEGWYGVIDNFLKHRPRHRRSWAIPEIEKYTDASRSHSFSITPCSLQCKSHARPVDARSLSGILYKCPTTLLTAWRCSPSSRFHTDVWHRTYKYVLYILSDSWRPNWYDGYFDWRRTGWIESPRVAVV